MPPRQRGITTATDKAQDTGSHGLICVQREKFRISCSDPTCVSETSNTTESETVKAGCEIMTDLENCLATIIEVFHKYSEKEGDKHKLKKSELKELLTHEMPSLTEHVKDQATMDSLMESLDADGDSECDFQEFMTFVTMVTICCHEFFEHHEDE